MQNSIGIEAYPAYRHYDVFVSAMKQQVSGNDVNLCCRWLALGCPPCVNRFCPPLTAISLFR
ncbi:hypothetical protein KCP77_03220 [Salmonella enterica subsp. enterica]|nr:hypothetical protein KCP77_03220 [Salmonella enterica subsp. enterica]